MADGIAARALPRLGGDDQALIWALMAFLLPRVEPAQDRLMVDLAEEALPRCTVGHPRLDPVLSAFRTVLAEEQATRAGTGRAQDRAWAQVALAQELARFARWRAGEAARG